MTLVRPETIDFAEHVIETLLFSDLDPNRYIVFGGAKLALENLRAARDIDLVVPLSYFEELLAAERPLAGLSLERVRSGFGQRRARTTGQVDPNQLPLDINAYSGLGSNLRFDRLWQRANLQAFGDLTLRCVTLKDVRARKIFLSRRNKQNIGAHLRDINLIEGFLQRQEEQPVIGH